MSSTEPVQQDSLLPITHHAVRLQAFEGPLDLLLFLIRKNEIDIYDIPIKQVTQQYLDILAEMQTPDLDLAGDFFVMASNLMYIKSRMLLPRIDRDKMEESEEDGDVDPRWELVKQLIEYKKFKEVSVELERLIDQYQGFVPRKFKGYRLNPADRPLKNSDKLTLWGAFNEVLRRLTEKMMVGEIHDEEVSTADQMEFILETLASKPQFMFSELFTEKTSINRFISTFLAILELARLNKISIVQNEACSDIECSVCEEEK